MSIESKVFVDVGKELARGLDSSLREELLTGSWKQQYMNDILSCYEVDASQWQRTMVDIPLPPGSPLAGSAEYRDYRDSWKDLMWIVSYQFQTQEEHNMYVFDVTIVDRESDEIVYDSKVVASTSEQAKMLAMADIMRESAPTNEVIANYHFSVVKIGEGYSK